MLLSLPLELFQYICSYLPVCSVLRLAACSHALHNTIYSDEHLWQLLALRDFGSALAQCPMELLSPLVKFPTHFPGMCYSDTLYRPYLQHDWMRSMRSRRRKNRLVEWANSADATVRVCALGPRRSGKTSALHILSFNKAPGEYMPTEGIDSYTLFTSQDRRVILRLVDTPGDLTDCSPLASVLFDECDICILCSPDSASWMRFIRSHSDAHVIVLASPNAPIPASYLSLGTDLSSNVRHTVLTRPATSANLRTILLDALLSYLPPPPSVPQPSIAAPSSPVIVYSQLHLDNDDEEEEDEDELDDN